MAEDFEQVRGHFREALDYVAAPGNEFAEIVASNLPRVVLVRPGYEGIAVSEGKYGTTLQGHEGQNPFVLAFRLVWVARYIQAAREPTRHATPTHREAAYATTSDFVAYFPEGEEWVRYIERIRIRDLGRDAI